MVEIMEEMTISRALNEVKMLDARIEKEIGSAVFVDAYQKKSQKLIRIQISKSDFEKNALAKYDKVTDLIKRRHACKASILKSNATVTVTIKNKTYIVIDAIERKRAIELDKMFLQKMKSEHSDIANILAVNESQLKEQISKMMSDVLASDRSESSVKEVSKIVREDNELTIVDPLSIKQKIDDLDSKIDGFLNDVDYALSESNATTKIQF